MFFNFGLVTCVYTCVVRMFACPHKQGHINSINRVRYGLTLKHVA